MKRKEREKGTWKGRERKKGEKKKEMREERRREGKDEEGGRGKRRLPSSCKFPYSRELAYSRL